MPIVSLEGMLPPKDLGPEYQKAINSPHWEEMKDKYCRGPKAKCEGKGCKVTSGLTLHHIHYRTIGKEKRKDVAVLCAECHMKREVWKEKRRLGRDDGMKMIEEIWEVRSSLGSNTVFFLQSLAKQFNLGRPFTLRQSRAIRKLYKRIKG